MTLIMHFLKMGKLPQSKQEAKKIKCWLAYFFIKNDQLYKKGFALPSLCCLNPKEANYVLRKNTRGYLWDSPRQSHCCPKGRLSRILLAKDEARGIIISVRLWQMLVICKNSMITFNRVEINLITLAVRPIRDWLVKSFPHDIGTVEICDVTIDYFTKWIEVEPLATITSNCRKS